MQADDVGTTDSAKLLAIYLNDHLAGATVGRELVRRAAASNRGSSYGQFLERLAREIDEDRESLIKIMGALNVGIDRVKVAGAWSFEKLGRLKLNGRLWGYSPLSRVVELEALTLGVRGKLSGWRSLQALGAEQRPQALPELIRRAERQLDELEPHRQRAAAEALTGDTQSTATRS
jgi:hypothetical protein